MLSRREMMSNETPIRTVRVDSKLWKAAKVQAKRSETTVSEVIVQALRDFTAKK
jgi:predicted HicB family RNase H-like nuclease